MKEIPMLYTTQMVQALLNRLKTETRRLKGLEAINENPDDWKLEWFDYTVGWCFTKKSSINKRSLKAKTFHQEIIKCPYGMKGDLIWVRETCMCVGFDKNEEFEKGKWIFKADNPEIDIYEEPKWKPNIHMPKEAARIWAKIESISVERLQSISFQSAEFEGIEFQEWTWGPIAFPDGEIDNSLVGSKTKFFKDYLSDKHWSSSAINSYKSLWIKINGQESWDANPWVWVVKFKVLSTKGKPDLSQVSNLTTHV